MLLGSPTIAVVEEIEFRAEEIPSPARCQLIVYEEVVSEGETAGVAMASSKSKGAADQEEKRSDESSQTPVYSQENVQHNTRIIHYSRTFLSIVGGIIAGVLGLNAISGCLFYFLIMVLVSGAIAAKTKFDVFLYFDSWKRITIDGITAGLMSFVLFWTFAYDIVHIF